MKDPRDPNDFDFPLMDDSPLNNNGRGYNRDEDDLRLNFDEEPDENNWWEDDDISWIGD